ncbi:MAG: LPS export ABC transporter permease LptF [Lysobacterales bacterium CG02_land_8_20_14_3_00_62_12]|nr:MAG: LPS export ABC transporter permease LptF [Xanthomonadales bacterium CG02_land_8_20_14_3_00_62_12]
MIIDRYLIREVTGPFVAVSAILVIVFVTYSLTIFLADASAGLLAIGQVAALTFLKAVIALEVLLPIGLYVGVLLGLGRLYSDSEMDALRAAGVGEWQILKPILRLALSLAVLVGLLSTVIRPLAYTTSYRLRAEAKVSSEIDRIKAGRFYSYADSGRTIFIETTGKMLDHLTGLFIRTRNAEGIQVIAAKSGQFLTATSASEHTLILRNANFYKRTAGGRDLFGQFDLFTIRLPIKQPEPVTNQAKVLPTLRLLHSQRPVERAEFQWRLSTPISTLLLALLAVPLSRSRPRQGRYARMLVALIVYALYFNLLSITRTWVEQGSLTNIAPVPMVMAGLAIVWFFVPWRRCWFALCGRKLDATA